MNPLEQFVNKFETLFPNSNINLGFEDNTNVYYHDVEMDKISFSDKCALEHIVTELKDEGYEFWFVYVGGEK